jgi:hypothetical protein
MNTIQKPRALPRTLWHIAALSVLLSLSYSTQADSCRPTYTLGSDTVHLPCVEWLPTNPPSTTPTPRQVYQAELRLENAEQWLFQWQPKTPLVNPSNDIGATYSPDTKNLYIPVIEVQTAPGVTVPYQVMLHENESGLLSITTSKPIPSIPAGNHAPVATSLTQTVDSQSPSYYPIQLAGTDADGDTLGYELLAPDQGEGYTQAYLDPDSHLLYVLVKPDFSGTVKLSYRVTDGKMFSNPATVSLDIGKNSGASEGLGSKRITGRTLASLPRKGVAKLSQGGSKLPSQVDLSDHFPTPRDQGTQNSCVGWAVGYGLKTYQEAVEMKWPLRDEAGKDIEAHLFSPAFLYNQIITRDKYGRLDQGIEITDALQFIVDYGAATWKAMPYGNVLDPVTMEISKEALDFRAQNWGRLQTTDDIKQSLAERNPVVTSMAVYEPFKGLRDPAVYNLAKGKYLGDHAVTIVGYDDNHAGGGRL